MNNTKMNAKLFPPNIVLNSLLDKSRSLGPPFKGAPST